MESRQKRLPFDAAYVAEMGVWQRYEERGELMWPETSDSDYEMWIEMGVSTREQVEEHKYHRDMRVKFRYTVSEFPAYFGNPFYTDSWIVALMVCAGRAMRMAEARIIDNRSGKHVVIL